MIYCALLTRYGRMFSFRYLCRRLAHDQLRVHLDPDHRFLARHQLDEIVRTGPAVEFDVTSRLNEFNELRVEVAFDPRSEPNVSGGLYGPVALDIRWE